VGGCRWDQLALLMGAGIFGFAMFSQLIVTGAPLTFGR
jgi:hypothetical protein